MSKRIVILALLLGVCCGPLPAVAAAAVAVFFDGREEEVQLDRITPEGLWLRRGEAEATLVPDLWELHLAPAGDVIYPSVEVETIAGIWRGAALDGEPEQLTFAADWLAQPVDLSVRQIGSIRFLPFPAAAAERFAEARSQSPRPRDLLLGLPAGDAVVMIEGQFERLETGAVQFRYQNRRRNIPRDRAAAIFPAAGAAFTPPDTGYGIHLRNGSHISGRLPDLQGEILALETAVGAVQIQWADVVTITRYSPRVLMLSELAPRETAATPLLTSPLWDKPWRVGRTLTGAPLRLGGRIFEQGIAMHGDCRLTYALPRDAGIFAAIVGLDPFLGTAGDCRIRVLVDGEERYAARLLPHEPPRLIRLEVAGAATLALVVEPGDGYDLGNHVTWARPRLIRQ